VSQERTTTDGPHCVVEWAVLSPEEGGEDKCTCVCTCPVVRLCSLAYRRTLVACTLAQCMCFTTQEG
jgi:hypothetical protein